MDNSARSRSRSRDRKPIVNLDRDDPEYIKEMQRPAVIKVCFKIGHCIFWVVHWFVLVFGLFVGFVLVFGLFVVARIMIKWRTTKLQGTWQIFLWKFHFYSDNLETFSVSMTNLDTSASVSLPSMASIPFVGIYRITPAFTNTAG